ncbi:MAG TPA: copper transporter [Nocardioidaceae bacterium]|nr:copper transporter [Nocardioidaceae bacterium]
MISFRYHIVSIVSVFLALAVGVALGGGPLKGEVDHTLVNQVKADRQAKADLKAQIAAMRNTNQFEDSFAGTVAPGLLAGTLKGRVVTLMVLPGASQDAVSSLSELIGQAGGTVGGTMRIGQKLLDVANKQLVDELGSQLLSGASDVNAPQGASGYQRMGALIARAVGTTEDGGAAVDDTANSILAGLSTAGLMTSEGDLNRRGSLVLMVAGPSTGTSEERQGANTIVSTLAEEIDADTDGVVITAPVDTARSDGLIATVRADVVTARDVSTVDVLDRTAGRVVTVMALADQARGKTGAYGAMNAADGAMPGAAPAGS